MIWKRAKSMTEDFGPRLFPSQRFRLGSIFVTPRAKTALARNHLDPLRLLERHARGDWGDIREGDRLDNDLAVRVGLRITSGYRLPDGERIWITTEADRSSTSFLVHEDYKAVGGFDDP